MFPGVAAAIVLTFAALTGCVSNTPRATPRSTVLFGVVMKGAVANDRQPGGVIVGVDEQQAAGGQQFAFPPDTRIPGNYTAFLVRLDLTPGKHKLTRLSGIASNGVAAPEFDVVTDMSFDVKAGETIYLGHLEWNYGGPSVGSTESHLVLTDAYLDDLPELVHAWPALRRHTVARHAPVQVVSVPAELRDRAALANSREPGQKLPPTGRLDAGAAAVLPVQARSAFRVFLTKSYPRAFAVADSGQIGMAAGGSDVIQRALGNCRRMLSAEPGSSCRLFALDDTLVPVGHLRPKASYLH
jgi:hypothetical protein